MLACLLVSGLCTLVVLVALILARDAIKTTRRARTSKHAPRFNAELRHSQKKDDGAVAKTRRKRIRT